MASLTPIRPDDARERDGSAARIQTDAAVRRRMVSKNFRVMQNGVMVGIKRPRGRRIQEATAKAVERKERPTRGRTAAPSGRDSARQQLRKLRRILDTGRHRIRWELIGVRHPLGGHEHGSRDTQGLHIPTRNDLMAEALAVVRLLRSRLAVPECAPSFSCAQQSPETSCAYPASRSRETMAMKRLERKRLTRRGK